MINFFHFLTLFFNKDFQSFCEEKIEISFSFKGIKVEVMYFIFDEKTNVLLETLCIQLEKQGFLKNFESSSLEVYLYFYFSWKDLRACFGFENIREFLVPSKKQDKRGKIFQRRSIIGYVSYDYSISNDRVMHFRFIFKDLFGWNTWGFKYLVESLGLFSQKESMDIYKKEMIKGLYEKPFDFAYYAMNDVFSLFCIVKEKVVSCNKILQEI